MDYEDIIQLLQSREKESMKLDQGFMPPKVPNIVEAELIENSFPVGSDAAHLLNPIVQKETIVTVSYSDPVDPVFLRARQQRVEIVITELDRPSELVSGPVAADRLVTEVSRYVASEQQLWPLIEDTTPVATLELRNFTQRSLKRSEEIIELTSDAAIDLVEGRPVAKSYPRIVSELFTEERADFGRVVNPLLSKAEVQLLRTRTQSLYPFQELQDVDPVTGVPNLKISSDYRIDDD